jgi:fucose permease
LRGFLPRTAAEHHESETRPDRPHPLTAWKEPRTLLIGVFVLCFAFTEGTGNDWLAVAMIDGYGAPAVVGPLTFAIFLAAMTLGRWFGPALIDRFGRVRVVRASALAALIGLMLVVFGQFIGVAMVGASLWGLGAALGFPVGMSAAADEHSMAAARVSVVASIGYTAFLAGPPLVGFLGDELGVLRALTVTAGLLALAAMIAGTVRPMREPTS